MTTPEAPREPKDVTVHGDRRIDDWFWLRDREDPRVLDYLKAENGYAEGWLAPHAALVETLYAEMYGRIRQDDDSVPYRNGVWWYSSRTLTGDQYPRHIRRRAAGAERRFDTAGADETLLDLNALAQGHPFCRLGSAAVSPDAARLAYTLDLTGGLDYTLHVKRLGVDGGADVRDAQGAWQMPEVSSLAWANDSRTLWYVTMNESKRSNRLWRHVVGSAEADVLLHEESDELYSVAIGKTRDERYAVVSIGSMDATEIGLLDADRPEAPLRTAFTRRPDVEIDLEHRRGRFWLRVNDTGRNFRLVSVADRGAGEIDLAGLDPADELIAARDDAMIDDLDVFAGHLVVTERVGGSLGFRVFDLERGGEHAVAFDETAYTVATGHNAEFETTTLRFVYTSMTTPASTYDYDLASRSRELRKVQPVPGYDASLYESGRVTARAADGTAVPISLVWRRGLRTPGSLQPLLLYGYGSYGYPLDPGFSQTRVSLLDRGVVFAIAHVRGGGDLGRTWYEAGKMANKAATFADFVACAEALVGEGWTEPATLAIQGGSAGGLLVAAAINLRRDLFRAAVLQVPFVDVVNTMLDETLPLTAGEFIEWGNPKLAEQYAWIRAYSPYDNLAPGDYPAMLVRAGLNDSQVSYWEPAKYVARLRTMKRDARPLLFKTNLDVGHGGASGRFDALREIAEDDAFLLAELGARREAAPKAAPAGAGDV